jgi:hypothetical protein
MLLCSGNVEWRQRVASRVEALEDYRNRKRREEGLIGIVLDKARRVKDRQLQLAEGRQDRSVQRHGCLNK